MDTGSPPRFGDFLDRDEARRSALETLIALCHATLLSPAGDGARAYLVAQGLDANAVQDLRLGLYASAHAVAAALRASGHEAAEVEDGALAWAKLEGFVVFPWADATGQPLTLYGRWPGDPPRKQDHPAWRHDRDREHAAWDRLSDAEKAATPWQEPKLPKTLALPGENTKASPLYFDRARAAGRRDVVLVEGVLDAALLQARGDARVIATGAAQLSREQVRTLARHGTSAVTICLDLDARERGTLPCIHALRAAGIPAYVAPPLPDGLDPDEFVLRDGLDAWNRHIARAEHAFRYEARALIDRHRGEGWTDRGLAECLDEAVAFDTAITDPERLTDLSSFFWPEVCAATGTDLDAVVERVASAREKVEADRQRRAYEALVRDADHKLRDGDLDAAKALLRGGMDRLWVEEQRRYAAPVRSVADELDEHEAFLAKWRGREFIGLPQRTLAGLDKMTLGLRALMLLAAAPNVGKTALAIQLGLDVVLHNPDAAFLFLSLEMNRRDMLTRMRSRLSGLDWQTLVFGSAPSGGGFFEPDELHCIREADEMLRNIGRRIRILDEENFPALTFESVIAQMENLKATTNTSRVFVLVDYLQVWPIPETEAKTIRTELDADKWRIGLMKRLRDAAGTDPILVISEMRKPKDEDAWAGSMADVMGSARGTYTPDMVFLLSPIPDLELGARALGSKAKEEERAVEGKRIRDANTHAGFADQRLSIVKGRDGVRRGTLDLRFHFRRSGYVEV